MMQGIEKSHVWQEVSNDEHGIVKRMTVPGGWLYLHIAQAEHDEIQGGRLLVFVPTPRSGLPPGLEVKG